MPNNIIDKIRVSGVTYDIVGQGGSGVSVVEVTQAEYDALPSSAKTDTSKMYVITDAQAGDLTQYWTSAQTSSAITEAVSGKLDTSIFESYSGSVDTALATKQTTLTAGTNITIVDNVISATGGGSSYTAGDGIDITNDVISVTGKVDTTTYSTYTAATYNRLDEDEEVTAAALNNLNERVSEDEEVTAAALNNLNEALSGKQDTLIAGENITISGNVISANGGGGGGTVESAITSGSTNAVESKAIWSAVTYDVSINETLEFDNTYAATNYPSGCNSVAFESNTGGTLSTGDYVFTSGGSEVAKLTCSVISWWPFKVGWTSSDPKLTYVVAEGNSAVTASYSELAGDIDGVTVPSAFTNTSTATASGENHLWINENTYRKDEVYNKSEINVLSGIVDTKLDATAYTPTVVDSALNVVSTNAVQNQALYSELRISNGGETETTLTFEGEYSTNYPSGCTKIKVEGITSNSMNFIHFQDDSWYEVGNIAVSNWGSISVNTSGFQAASYEISGSSVIISYPTVTTVTRLDVSDSTKYTYKAVTSSTTPLKDQVVANTTALGGKVNTSAITTTITSASTDSEIPSAKAVYDVLGDVETLLSQI